MRRAPSKLMLHKVSHSTVATQAILSALTKTKGPSANPLCLGIGSSPLPDALRSRYRSFKRAPSRPRASIPSSSYVLALAILADSFTQWVFPKITHPEVYGTLESTTIKEVCTKVLTKSRILSLSSPYPSGRQVRTNPDPLSPLRAVASRHIFLAAHRTVFQQETGGVSLICTGMRP